MIPIDPLTGFISFSLTILSSIIYIFIHIMHTVYSLFIHILYPWCLDSQSGLHHVVHVGFPGVPREVQPFLVGRLPAHAAWHHVRSKTQGGPGVGLGCCWEFLGIPGMLLLFFQVQTPPTLRCHRERDLCSAGVLRAPKASRVVFRVGVVDCEKQDGELQTSHFKKLRKFIF